MGLSPAAIGSRLPTMLKLLVVAVHVVLLMLLPQLCLGVRHIHASVQARLRTPAPFHSCKWWAGLGLVVAGIVKLACLSSNFKLRPRGAFFFQRAPPCLELLSRLVRLSWPPLEQTCQAAWVCATDSHTCILAKRYTHRHNVFPGNWQLPVCLASAAC